MTSRDVCVYATLAGINWCEKQTKHVDVREQFTYETITELLQNRFALPLRTQLFTNTTLALLEGTLHC